MIDKIGRGTMISIGTVIATVIPATIAWSKLESRVDQKVDKLELSEQMGEMRLQLQRIESNQESLSRDVKRALKEK